MCEPALTFPRLPQVLRTNPAGVRLMHKYPDIGIDPGVTPWAEDSAWKRDKVFADLARWQYTQLSPNESHTAQSRWAALSRWHLSHPTSDTLVVGQHAQIGDGLELRTPLLSWGEMWKVLKTHVVAAPARAGAPVAAASAAAAGKRRVDRQALGASTSAAEVNIVTHPGYTERDRRIALLNDDEKGRTYLRDNIDKKNALFFIKLEHAEGELAVGLGRRTFDADLDNAAASSYAIEWFERKNKRVESWGKQPGFRLAIESYDAKRRRIVQSSVETLNDFLPVAVQCTPTTAGSDEPSLSQDCMAALRAYLGEGEEGEEEGEEQPCEKRPRKSGL